MKHLSLNRNGIGMIKDPYLGWKTGVKTSSRCFLLAFVGQGSTFGPARASVIAKKRRNKDIDQVHDDLKARVTRIYVRRLHLGCAGLHGPSIIGFMSTFLTVSRPYRGFTGLFLGLRRALKLARTPRSSSPAPCRKMRTCLSAARLVSVDLRPGMGQFYCISCPALETIES